MSVKVDKTRSQWFRTMLRGTSEMPLCSLPTQQATDVGVEVYYVIGLTSFRPVRLLSLVGDERCRGLLSQLTLANGEDLGSYMLPHLLSRQSITKVCLS
jgi:hypothetical protein